MRLLIASGTVAPEIGGPCTFVASAVPRLVARGLDVRVLAFAPTGDPHPSDPAPVTRIARDALPGRFLRYARAYRSLARSADVVLALGLLLPRPTPNGVPVVIKVPGDTAWERAVARGWVAATEDIDGFDRRRHSWRVESLKQWRRAEVRRASHVVVPSEYLREMVRSWGVAPERLTLVPNAAPPNAHATAPDATSLRRDLGWAPGEPVAVVAGRLVTWKHVDLVIEAAREVPGLRLVVAGDGPERERLAVLARARAVNAEFTGAIDSAQLSRLLRAAGYFVLYSSYEGMSHTALEALAVGTPIIASRRGGNPEVVEHGRNGLLVDHPDVAALGAALREAFSPGRRRQLAAGAATSLDGREHERQAEILVDLLASAAARAENRGRRAAKRP